MTEQGATIRKRGLTLVIEKESVQLEEIELHRLSTVLLYGNIQVTTQALHALLKERIELALLSQAGRLPGRLGVATLRIIFELIVSLVMNQLLKFLSAVLLCSGRGFAPFGDGIVWMASSKSRCAPAWAIRMAPLRGGRARG